ncbi:unnamed protein product [Ectocarpus sp. 12 AP-2014]
MRLDPAAMQWPRSSPLQEQHSALYPRSVAAARSSREASLGEFAVDQRSGAAEQPQERQRRAVVTCTAHIVCCGILLEGLRFWRSGCCRYDAAKRHRLREKLPAALHDQRRRQPATPVPCRLSASGARAAAIP